MRRLPPLATLRAFEAAARHLSFKQAAAELAVTPTAISHQIRLLEETLGRRLFERRARRVALTAAGQVLYPALREGLDAMARAVDAVRAMRNDRAVTLTATMTFTSKWLVPRVAAFRSRHPDIGLRVLASNDPIDLESGAADIAVRYGRGPYPGHRFDPLFQSRFAPVCSPRLDLRNPADFGRQTLIHFQWRHVDPDTPLWPRWFAKAGLPYRPEAELTFSDETHALQAAAAGQGVVLANLAFVADELASGALVVPFGPFLAGHGFWTLTPDRDAAKADEEVAAVQTWLATEAAAFARRLAAIEASVIAGPTDRLSSRYLRRNSDVGEQS